MAPIPLKELGELREFFDIDIATNLDIEDRMFGIVEHGPFSSSNAAFSGGNLSHQLARSLGRTEPWLGTS
jgi:hypothetical protein